MTLLDPSRRVAEFVALMASVMALTALSIDIMLPGLPHIGEDFGISGSNRHQLVISYYLFGLALGQFVVGPLSDRFGRKLVILVGLGFYAAAAALCVTTETFSALLGARFVQGMANAAPRVIAMAVVRDVYKGRRMAEIMSFVMTIFIIMPVLAPSFGAAIMLVGSWRYIFVFLSLFSMLVFVWVMLRLPETRKPEDREPFSVTWLFTAIRTVLTTRETLGYTLAAGVGLGALMAYVNSAEQVYSHVYDAGRLFPIFFGISAAGMAAASLLNSRFVGRLGMRVMSHGALFGFIMVAALHGAWLWLAGTPPFWMFIGAMSLKLFFLGFLLANFNALSMEPMGRIAGTASSFVGAVTTIIAALIGLYVGQKFDGTAMPLTFSFVWIGLACLAVVALTERGKLFGAGERAADMQP